jgi:hypothetical protein
MKTLVQFAAVASMGVLAMFGVIEYLGHSMSRVDGGTVLPMWYWTPPVIVVLAGIVVTLDPMSRWRKKCTTEQKLK